MTSNHYHKEIDGLRAISVLIIILFHLDVELFRGGFVGVDVFFVVSGYLITQIITSNLQSAQFSFKDFYIRRSTRILPALIATVFLTLLVATFLQQPKGLVHTAEESIAALLSLSNFYFWNESSYWAPSSEKYALLHTWSLGVEEQFYLVYPLMLFACYRFGGMRTVAAALFLIIAVGTYASEAVLKTDRTAAFYFTPLRFYEFAVGGLGTILAVRVRNLSSVRWLSAILSTLGLAAIFFAALEFHPFLYALPGAATLIPAGGALLVLLAGASPVANLTLINPVMSWLGKTSYSLYLIHWPIIVFYRYYFGSSLSLIEQALLLVVILVAAELLCRTVERRFRLLGGQQHTAGGISSRSVLKGILVATLTLIAASSALIYSKGLPSRMPTDAQELMKIDPAQDMRQRKLSYKAQCVPQGRFFCGKRSPEPDATNILLLGDSRVLDIYTSLREAYPSAAIRASFAMGCAPVFSKGIGWSKFFPDCESFNIGRLEEALNSPQSDIIYLAQDINAWRMQAILETVERLRSAGKIVYVLGEFRITGDRTPIEIEIDNHRFPRRSAEIFLTPHPFSMDGKFADDVRSLGATYISYKPLFHDADYHFEDRETGKLLTYDGIHFNMDGARKFGAYLRENYPLPSSN